MVLKAGSGRRLHWRSVGRARRHWRTAVRLLEGRGLREEADRVRGALGDLGLRPTADQRSRIDKPARSRSYAFGAALPVLMAGLALVPDAGDHPDEDHHAMDLPAGLDIDLVTDVIDESQDPVPDFGGGYVNDGDAAPDRSGGGGGGDHGGGGGGNSGGHDHGGHWD